MKPQATNGASEMKVIREKPSMFGIELYDKRFLVIDHADRETLKRTVQIMELARRQVTEDSYLDMELGSIEGRLLDLLEFSKIEL